MIFILVPRFHVAYFQKTVSGLETELNHLKEVGEVHKRRVNDVISSVLQDLGEMGVALGNKDQVCTSLACV